MKKVLLVTAIVVGGLFTLAVFASTINLIFAFRDSPPQEGAVVNEDDTLGQCTPQRWRAYSKVLTEIAPGGFGGSPVEFAPGVLLSVRQQMDNLDLHPGKTMLVAVSNTTGKIYPYTCAEKRCSLKEAFEPEQLCLTDGGAECHYIAAVFEDEVFCIAHPRELP